MLNKPYQIPIRVYAEDTDFMGIVYHANYVNFFERSRTELLRNHGITLTTMATYDTYFAIRDLQIRYHFSARLDDLLQVTATVTTLKGCSLLMHQTMINQNERLIAEANLQIVVVDAYLKPKKMPKAFLNIEEGG